MKSVFLAGALLLAGAMAAEQERPARPIPEIERVVIVSIDGLRPDRLLLAHTPVLRELIGSGAYTMWANTTGFATTLPSHISMLTGVNPRKHGIEWNDALPLPQQIYPKFPTVFELAKKWGYKTALVSGKKKFVALLKPGTVDVSFVPEADLTTDAPVADEATRVIREARPDLLFVHFGEVDKVGHKFGWGSREQLAAIEDADVALGRVLAALDETGLRARTLLLISTDHGGQGLTHGPDDPRSRHIPWIAQGPGVKRGFDLTQAPDLVVHTEDTCATACYVLGLGQFPYFDGKPVLLAFAKPPQT